LKIDNEEEESERENEPTESDRDCSDLNSSSTIARGDPDDMIPDEVDGQLIIKLEHMQGIKDQFSIKNPLKTLITPGGGGDDLQMKNVGMTDTGHRRKTSENPFARLAAFFRVTNPEEILKITTYPKDDEDN
jgi:hypothetical protein